MRGVCGTPAIWLAEDTAEAAPLLSASAPPAVSLLPGVEGVPPTYEGVAHLLKLLLSLACTKRDTAGGAKDEQQPAILCSGHMTGRTRLSLWTM